MSADRVAIDKLREKGSIEETVEICGCKCEFFIYNKHIALLAREMARSTTTRLDAIGLNLR